MILKRVSITFLMAIFFINAYSQYQISGSVRDGVYGDRIPFCIIKIDSATEVIADSKGEFSINSSNKISQLEFRAPFHRPLAYEVKSDSVKVEIRLIAFTIFLPLRSSDKESVELLRKWQNVSESQNYENNKNIAFDKNSTIVLKSSDVRRFKNNFNKYFKLTGQRLKAFSKNHYLIYSHSSQLIEFKNSTSREEIILNSKNIGIKNPLELSDGKDNYEISIYSDYWRIGNSYYPNPLAGDFIKRYHFKVYESIKNNQGKVSIIQFYPHLNQKANKLRGFILLDEHNNRIIGLWAEKAVDTDSKIRISAEYESFGNLSVLKSSYLVQNLTEIQSFSTQLKLESQNQFENFRYDSKISEKRFDEIVKIIPQKSEKKEIIDNLYEDSLIRNTEEFYETNPGLESIYRSITFGKKLYKGRFDIGNFDIEMDRIINFNNHEGWRLGFGMSTNEKLWKRNITSAYTAYGFRDETLKFGLSNRYFLDNSFWNWFEVYFSRDVYESGSTTFEQNEKLMFRSEALRRYGISVMDNELKIGSSLNIKVSKYLQLRSTYQYSQLDPTYDYAFNGDTSENYQYGETSFMLRFAPGEERIRNGRNLIISKNPSPIFLLSWSLGRKDLANDFNYNKIETQISFQKNILGYGRSSLRIQAGYLDRALPYHKMFVGRGGLRNFTVVFHNTFETMAYNEFLSDRYLYFFYSHNFGPFFIPFLNHFSSLEMQHNFGVGDLRDQNIHALIDFKLLNKGYLESGLFMNDIILLNASGLKTGLGAGFFYRYGAYQNPNFSRNIVFKISINLDL